MSGLPVSCGVPETIRRSWDKPGVKKGIMDGLSIRQQGIQPLPLFFWRPAIARTVGYAFAPIENPVKTPSQSTSPFV
jgi:hypothetical protein